VADSHPPTNPDLLEQIPDPDTVRGWLAEAIRRADLLRSLLRVAQRKAAYRRPDAEDRRGVSACRA
jgi:hypothetical protein